MNKIVKIGHSPDADDAFMFYGLTQGLVELNGFKIEHIIEDIQSLNKRALKGELDVTAISAAVYPFIADQYWILSCGASVGRNYGPIIVSDKPFSHNDLQGKKIAVPGLQTTAFLLLKIFLDDFEPVEINFQEIISAVKQKKVDAGLIIHEGQINYGSFGLHKCLDLGKLWYEKYSLPIPLGLDVVRKDLGRTNAKKINSVLRQSIRYAIENEKPAIEYALKFGRGLSEKDGEKFVRMYVNEDTIDLGLDSKKALEKLYALGEKCKIFGSVPEIEIIS